MDWFRRGRALLADPTWRYPILFGLLTIPFTVAQQVRGAEVISPSSLFWAALLAERTGRRRDPPAPAA